ncbi:hypothetical protein LB503_012647 [Fusarium chuoi]|nr:hypothetical protein LB503_012647 [Fusarium chuoi]
MKLNSIVFSATAAAAFNVGNIQLPFSHESLASSPLLDLHKSLVERPSITGFTVETQAVAKNRDNILAYYNNTRNTRVLVTSHIDTVPPFWPYERRGDEIWGRGTVDAKGSVAAQIIAVSGGDVALLFVVGEETGGPGMGNVNDLGLSWESVIFGEPTELKLARGHKGGLGFTIKANGKAGHSGYPETGSNAIDSLKVELPGSKEFGNSTLNVGRIEGGVAGNVIPASAYATGGVRVAGGTPEGIRDLIRQAVKGSDPSLVVEFSYGIGPVPTDYDVDGFETVVLNYGTDIPRLKGSHKRYLYGPGSILEAHSAHEHLKVSDLEQAVEGYKKLISHALDQPSEL